MVSSHISQAKKFLFEHENQFNDNRELHKEEEKSPSEQYLSLTIFPSSQNSPSPRLSDGIRVVGVDGGDQQDMSEQLF